MVEGEGGDCGGGVDGGGEGGCKRAQGYHVGERVRLSV